MKLPTKIGRVPFLVRLPRVLYDRLKIASAREGESINAHMIRLLAEGSMKK